MPNRYVCCCTPWPTRRSQGYRLPWCSTTPAIRSALVDGLAKQLGIELLYLTSYSPNLNLIERVWKFVKAECLRTKYYDNYEKFHAAIQQCLDDLPSKHKAAMGTLLTHNFQTFENVSLIAA